MKKIIFSFFVMLLCFSSPVFSHPPSDIKLTYDQEAKVLHIQMRHTTVDARKDCIRKLVVEKNSKEVATNYYNIQPNTMEFSEDVPADAKGGDTFSIIAYSRDGGSGSASIVVEKKEETEKKEDAQEKVNKEDQQAIEDANAQDKEYITEETDQKMPEYQDEPAAPEMNDTKEMKKSGY